VRNFPKCYHAISGKFIWNVDDPTDGINVPAWKQLDYDIECGDDEECESSFISQYKGEYLNGKLGKKCYAYQVLNHFKIGIKW
ncbi:hypothetical protein, partial [Streptococcus pneumoniae]|uniref:hypothetical protein n=1 Tax=Streptococcus pneumoniae TaxID=1313 RepID=UPI0018B0521E